MGQRLVDDGAEGQRLAELLAGEGLAEGFVEIEDERAGLRALAGEEALGGEAREGEQPGRDVGLVAIRVQRLLGAEVGVERGEAGSSKGFSQSVTVWSTGATWMKMRWNGSLAENACLLAEVGIVLDEVVGELAHFDSRCEAMTRCFLQLRVRDGKILLGYLTDDDPTTSRIERSCAGGGRCLVCFVCFVFGVDDSRGFEMPGLLC